MNRSNIPAPGDTSLRDTTVVVPDKAANEAAVDAPTDPKIDDDAGDKINSSSDKINAAPSVAKFRINDKRGAKH